MMDAYVILTLGTTLASVFPGLENLNVTVEGPDQAGGYAFSGPDHDVLTAVLTLRGMDVVTREVVL